MSIPVPPARCRTTSSASRGWTFPGGGQVEVKGNYAYIGHMSPPHGTSIVDISDPRKPRLASRIDLPGNDTHTHKVRVFGDDYMIVNSERYRRHFFRKGKLLPEIKIRLEHQLGRSATDAELAMELGVAATDIAALVEAEQRGYC